MPWATKAGWKGGTPGTPDARKLVTNRNLAQALPYPYPYPYPFP